MKILSQIVLILIRSIKSNNNPITLSFSLAAMFLQLLLSVSNRMCSKDSGAVSILLTTNLNCPLLKDLTLLRRVFWTLSSAGETLSSPFSGPAVSQGLFCNSFVLVSMTARSECLVFVLPTWCFLFASCVNNLQQDDRHLKSLTFIICAGVGSRSLRVSTARASDSAQCSVGRPQVCVCVCVHGPRFLPDNIYLSTGEKQCGKYQKTA